MESKKVVKKSSSTSTAGSSTVRKFRLRTGGVNGVQTHLYTEKIMRKLGYVNLSININGNQNGDVIDIPLVDAKTLAIVIDWCIKHKDDEPLQQDELIKIRDKPVPENDKGFFNYLSNSEIFALTIAADFLDVPGLLDICCKTVAEMLKGMSAEKIREKFGVEDDLSADEKQELQNEHQGINRISLS